LEELIHILNVENVQFYKKWHFYHVFKWVSGWVIYKKSYFKVISMISLDHVEHFEYLPWWAWIKPPYGQILTFFKKYLSHCNISISFGKWKIWAFSEMFPIEFGPFFIILWYFEKNRYFGGMAKLLYTGSHLVTPQKNFLWFEQITSKWPKKVSRRCKTFLSILLNIHGFQAIHGRKFECHLTHRRKYFKRKVGLVEVLDLVSGAHVW
jgi:hypothetical protein